MMRVGEHLEDQIDDLRQKMEYLAAEKGLNDPHVLRISQKIDALHNKLNQIALRQQTQISASVEDQHTYQKSGLPPHAAQKVRKSGRFTFLKEAHIPYVHDRSVSAR